MFLDSVQHDPVTATRTKRQQQIMIDDRKYGEAMYSAKQELEVAILGEGIVSSVSEQAAVVNRALVTKTSRAATIICHEDNCHFLRVDKGDFNRILRDVEANTVRLKEHGEDVLVLEKISSNAQTHSHYKYKVISGTASKMLEHLLETRLDSVRRGSAGVHGMMDLSNPLRRCDLTNTTDLFMDDFLLTHIIFMDYQSLTEDLLVQYPFKTISISINY
ncbi:unnamed protein product, partial [Meganyctiphanes norvegica]